MQPVLQCNKVHVSVYGTLTEAENARESYHGLENMREL